MSCVGWSCISPVLLCAHENTESWKLNVSVLSLWSVSRTLPVRLKRKIWVGSTVKVAADTTAPRGPLPKTATATATVARNRSARWRAGFLALVHVCLTAKVSAVDGSGLEIHRRDDRIAIAASRHVLVRHDLPVDSEIARSLGRRRGR
jgi:hypothetical protein